MNFKIFYNFKVGFKYYKGKVCIFFHFVSLKVGIKQSKSDQAAMGRDRTQKWSCKSAH